MEDVAVEANKASLSFGVPPGAVLLDILGRVIAAPCFFFCRDKKNPCSF
jgi:hypothetical protein